MPWGKCIKERAGGWAGDLCTRLAVHLNATHTGGRNGERKEIPLTVDERLDRLERQNRRLKAWLASLLVVAVAAGLLGFAQPDSVPDVVEARAFHVVGKDGAVLVKLEDTLGTGRGLAGTITTLNGEGKQLVRLAATENGDGGVTTMNGEGKVLVTLAAKEGAGTVGTWNGEGKILVALMANEGAGAITTLNEEQETVVMLGATKAGDGVVQTMNREGKELIRLSAARNGAGAVGTFDPSGKRAPGILMPR